MHEYMHMKVRLYMHDILPNFRIIPQATELHHEVMQNYKRNNRNIFKAKLVQKGK